MRSDARDASRFGVLDPAELLRADYRTIRSIAVAQALHGVPGHDGSTASVTAERRPDGTYTGMLIVSCPRCGDALPADVRGPHEELRTPRLRSTRT